MAKRRVYVAEDGGWRRMAARAPPGGAAARGKPSSAGPNWACPTCHFQDNWGSRQACRNCGTPRPKAAAAAKHKNAISELEKVRKQLEEQKRHNQKLKDNIKDGT